MALGVENDEGKVISKYPHVEIDEDPDDLRHYSSEISVDHRSSIGRVHLVLSTRQAREAIADRTTYLAFLIILTVLVFSSILIFVLNRWVGQPVRRLALEARRLGDGELERPIEARSQDEIGLLAETLNAMRIGILSFAQSLSEQNHDLQRLAQVKDEFLTNMSHEIRTPLNGVAGSLELFNETELSDRHRELVRTMRSSALDLTEIIDTILDIANLESSEVVVQRAAFSPRKLLGEAIESVQGLISTDQLTLGLRIDDRVPPMLLGDARLIRKVLARILNNAVKFTPSGSVTVEVEPAGEDRPDTQVFRIRDTGVGIDPNQLPSIFNKFTQGDQSTTKAFAGLGLGLTICKSLVDRLGGTSTSRVRWAWAPPSRWS